jgi:hypothetical protein
MWDNEMFRKRLLGRLKIRNLLISLKGLVLCPLVIAAILALGLWSPAWAEDSSQSGPAAGSVEKPTLEAGEMNIDQLKAKRAAFEGSQDLGESVKKSVLSLLDQAIRFR